MTPTMAATWYIWSRAARKAAVILPALSGQIALAYPQPSSDLGLAP